MKPSLISHIWNNSKELIVFCLVVIPAFVFGATLISGWENSFIWVFVVSTVILLAAIIYDYTKWRKL